jgi:hypothetical protein
MSSGKTTHWFPGSVKPAREGVYEVRVRSVYPTEYKLWDGRRWRYVAETPENAAEQGGPGMTPHEWRGLMGKA